MTETIYLPALRDDGETEVMVEFTINSWGSPAQTYGPPESCDPGYPMEVDITDCWLISDQDKADAPRVILTDAERHRIETAFCENPPEPDYDDREWEHEP